MLIDNEKTVKLGFALFVKCGGILSVENICDLLDIPRGRHLGTTTIERLAEQLVMPESKRHTFFVSTAGEWVCFLDTSDTELKKGLEDDRFQKASTQYDIYTFNVSDEFYAYDYSMYKKGSLVRQCSYEEHWITRDECICYQVGEPLPGETELLQANPDRYKKMYLMAEFHGVEVQLGDNPIEMYEFGVEPSIFSRLANLLHKPLL